MTRNDLLRRESDADHPDTWRTDGLTLPLSYRFEPGAEDDGVTVHVPVGVLARLGGDTFAWQVPALREELVTALIKSLPKDLRRNFVPAPDTARVVVAALEPESGPLLESVQRALQRHSGILVPIGAFDLDKIPAHLRLTFAVESPDGVEVARGKDLESLQHQLSAPAREAVAQAVAGDLTRIGLRSWPDDVDEIPRVIEQQSGGHLVRGFPALVDAGAAVDLLVYATAAEQAAAMGPGMRRLLRLATPSPVKTLERQLDPRTRLVLGANPDGSLTALLDDCADAAVDFLAPQTVWSRAEFTALRDRVAAGLVRATADVVARATRVLTAVQEVQLGLPGNPPANQAEAIEDIRAQLERLLPAGFVAATGAAHLNDLARYVTAISRRLDRLPQGVHADRERMLRVHAVEDAYDELVEALPAGRAAAEDVRDIARLIEELRVSLWAQQLGTARSVSEQRIHRAIDAVRL